jgi:hypothetical protein
MCVAYLSLPGFSSDNDEGDIAGFVSLGYYGFSDYAYAYWAHHLDACARLNIPVSDLDEARETVEAFIDMHWTEPQTKTVVRKSFKERWKSLENNNNIDRLALAGYLAHRQLVASTKMHVDEQVLSLHQTIAKVRQQLEDHFKNTRWTTANQPDRFRMMYGADIFKCPRVNCMRFYNGFGTRLLRDEHVPKHERSFFCSFSSCHMGTLGCATLKELQKHETEYHGTFNFDEDELDFPEEPVVKSAFQCSQCDAEFTRNNNLKIHMRKHNAPNQKAFICTQCGKSFARLGDRTRHESTTHSNAKTFACGGTLQSGATWGCGREFNRGDMLSRHWKSEKGKTCLRSKEEEEEEAATSSTLSTSAIPSLASTPSNGL